MVTHMATTKKGEEFRHESLTLLGLRCFLKRINGGDFDTPANSKAKEARTMRLSTVIVHQIVYYTVSMTQQLKFLGFYFSIVCNHCSIVCFITKWGERWSKFQVPHREMKFTELVLLMRISKICIF